MTYDNSVAPLVVSINKSPKEQEEFDYRVAVYHRTTPMAQADAALSTIEKELDKLNKVIRRERGDLRHASWDLTIKDGKIAVVGDIDKSDAAWLEKRLNGNGALVAAVDTYVNAAHDYLETSDENPAYNAMSFYTGRAQLYDFHDVKKQLEGVLRFKDLASTVKAQYEPLGVTGYPAGYMSLEILATRLAGGS